MAPRPVLVNGLPASQLVASLPMAGDDMHYCLSLLEQLETADPYRCDEIAADLQQFICELMTTALTLQAIVDQNCFSDDPVAGDRRAN